MKKGFVAGLATGLTIAGASLVLANSQIQAILNDQIKVSLDGQIQEFRDETTNEIQYPITYHDRTYLPLRTVANLVGVDVDYNSSTNTAILKTGNYSEYIFPNSDKTEITQDLSKMSKDELELAKNEIFARYGYDFSSKTLQDYFSAKSWYKKETGKKISVSELNSVEQKNVAYIDKYIAIKNGTNSTIKKVSENQDFVYTRNRIAFEDEIEYGRTYNYPYINIDSQYAKSINNSIEQLILSKGEPGDATTGVDYKYCINNNILFVILNVKDDYGNNRCDVYTISLENGNNISNSQIIAKNGLQEKSVMDKIYNEYDQAIQDLYNEYKQNNSELAENLKKSALYIKNQVKTDNALIYFENNQLHVIVELPNLAGATSGTHFIDRLAK